jgi:hypothetical protein
MSADTRPMTLPIVERLRHDAEQMIAQDAFYWARATNEAADTIEELVEALRKAAPFVGHVAVHDPEAMVAGSRARELCDEIDALLAKIGGDS